MSFVIFDIDGSLANCEHRRHHVHGPHKNWTAFFEEACKDTVYEGVANTMHALQSAGETALVVSARPENYRDLTEIWLYENNIVYTQLYMRKKGDFRPDDVIKKEILDQIILDWGKPWLAVDDRPRVLKMWAENGITTMQVGNYKQQCLGKPNLFVMVGPSGAGKSTMIEKDSVLSKCFRVSSDHMREVICKNFKDQTKNMQVFEAVHETVKTLLLNGVDVVLDATNIKDADRKKSVLSAPAGCNIHYVVVDRSLQDKIRDAGWRNDVTIKGKNLVEYHHNTMQSNLKAILSADGFENVTVIDRRI